MFFTEPIGGGMMALFELQYISLRRVIATLNID
jgi:hypothetical protein